MPPFPTLLITIALISFFVALRITVRDREYSAEGDFLRIVILSFTTAAGLRLALLIA